MVFLVVSGHLRIEVLAAFMVSETKRILAIDYSESGFDRPCWVSNVTSALEVVQEECLRSEGLPLGFAIKIVKDAVVDHEHFTRFCISPILGLERFADVSSRYIVAEQY